MSAFLTPEWFDTAAPALAALPSAGDVDAVVQYVVSSTPEGKLTFHAVIEGGVVVDLASGKASDPTAIISCSYDAALDVVEGRKSADVAFMDASFKVEGDHKTWLIDLRDVRAAVLDAIDPAVVRKRTIEKTRERLEELIEPYAIPKSRVHLPAGRVGHTVAGTAHKVKADLLVMGTAAHRARQMVGLGNSAERVLAHAPCDVLAVHPD